MPASMEASSVASISRIGTGLLIDPTRPQPIPSTETQTLLPKDRVSISSYLCAFLGCSHDTPMRGRSSLACPRNFNSTPNLSLRLREIAHEVQKRKLDEPMGDPSRKRGDDEAERHDPHRWPSCNHQPGAEEHRQDKAMHQVRGVGRIA